MLATTKPRVGRVTTRGMVYGCLITCAPDGFTAIQNGPAVITAAHASKRGRIGSDAVDGVRRPKLAARLIP